MVNDNVKQVMDSVIEPMTCLINMAD